jgi:predicted ATP-grasp superfamily ATP-dependent carboligase
MDHAWSLVYSHYDDFSEHTQVVPCPDPVLRSELSDKASLLKTASAYGVPTPKTFVPSSLDEAFTLRHDLPYPVLLKPAHGTGGVGIQLASDPTGFENALRDTELAPTIQEFIEGDDLELTVLSDHGEPLAGSAYVTLRNRPLPYGPPVACRTIRDEHLMSIGTTFLQELRYHGVAHLDFRRDRRDGQPKLLDFNVRLAGSNEISTRTGVDFALMLYQMALGRRVAPCFEYEVNTEFRWLMFGELQHLIQTPRKRAVIRDLMRWRDVQADISLTDPIPHMIDTFNVIADKSFGVVCRHWAAG